MNPRIAIAALVALFVGAAGLITLELANGAANAGALAVRDPCEPRPSFPGEGLDATLQRIVLDGLDGAACRLHTTREELVLSIGGGTEAPRHWDAHTIEVALRAGMLRSVDEAVQRGDIPSFLAPTVRGLVERLPLQRLIRGGISLNDLLG